MANSREATNVAKSPEMQARVDFYMLKGAVAIMAESLSTDGHTERVAYAKTIMDGTASVLKMSISCMSNATILAAIDEDAADGLQGVTDANLEFAVNERLTAFAGHETGSA